jgi:lipopolysaccharide heptosyltransferase I
VLPLSAPPQSVLIVKPSSLGDIVHTLPAVALLKRHWPRAVFRWMVNPEWAPLLEGNPCLDEVLHFPRREFRGFSGWLKFLPWLRSLRPYRSDLVLDFQGLLRSAILARACRGGQLAGLSDAREGASFFYDHVVDVRGRTHAVDRYLELATAFTGPRGPTGPLGTDPSLLGTDLEWPLPAGQPVQGVDPGYVLLHPFSRGTGKSLTPAQVSEFCEELAPMRVVVAGRAEPRIAPGQNVLDLLNRTSMAELLWLIRQSAYVVSVDSGPMHIAAALTSRLLSIHTWSDPRKVGPYRADAWVWQQGKVFQRGSPLQTQPVEDIRAVARFVAGRL